MPGIADKHCQRDVALLGADEIDVLLKAVAGWDYSQAGNTISRQFKFKNYQQTMQFVNQVAAIADEQDHHPDMLVSYNKCTVTYSTHSVGGLSENDFICAARINQLVIEK